MFKIQTLNTIAAVGLNQFPKSAYELGAELTNPDAILLRSQDLHKMSVPPSVLAVGRAGAGVNNIPVDTFTKLGIPVLNTPGANANAVRELVIAGMLLASRNICQAWQYVSQLNSRDAALEKQIEQDKKQFAGFELMGKTLGLVGLGNIGVKVANAALSLGMNVIGFDPTITVSRAWELSASVQQAHNIDELLAQADFISFHVPLNDETRNMINTQRFNVMKQGVVLLNFARDGIIDNTALAKALDEKKVFAYINDFPSADLKNHPRVISLPHLGASTKEAEDNCAVMIVKQMRDFLEQGIITNSVNFPTVESPILNSGTRIAIANANIPNMVAQISTQLADAKLNIVSLLNKSRAEIAYTLIDLDGAVDENLMQHIAGIKGVIQVRKILPVSKVS
jgi:D-3-phosphoglycerate dehydrogenase